MENKLFQTIFKVSLCSKAEEISLKTYINGFAWITKYSNDRNWINKNSGLIQFKRSKNVINLILCSQFDTILFCVANSIQFYFWIHKNSQYLFS